MRKLALHTVIAIAVLSGANLATAGTTYPPLPYTDGFSGADPTVDDNNTTFWKVIPGSVFSPNQVAETAGTLRLVSDNSFGATLVGLNASSTFNFFATPLAFTVSGLDMSLSTATPASAQLFRFSVQDSGGTTPAGDATSQTSGGVSGAVVIDITGTNHLTLSLKEGNLAVSNPLLDLTLAGTATGLALTLDGTAATYSLLVNESSSSQTFSGSLPGLTQAGWGANGEKGWSAISVAGMDNGGTAGVVQVNIDSVSVTAVPEPSTWASLVAGGTLLLASQRLRRRWR